MYDLKYNRLKEVLADRGVKQRWLAERLGKTERQINAYVANSAQPPISVLFDIAELLHVPARELLCEQPKSKLESIRTTATHEDKRKPI